MKIKKTISGLFRDNQHQLNEKPSPQAWRRLERKLEDHRRHQKVSILRQATSIAAVLALGGLITLLGLLFDSQKPNALALNNYTPEQLEDLQVSDNEDIRIAEYIRTYRDRLTQPIAEGDFTKRITLSGNVEKVMRSQIKVSLNDFQWLKGTWRSDINGLQSLEFWTRKNAQTLTGQGFLVEAGDTASVDQMRIFQAKGKIFFETHIEKDKAPVQYTLKQFFADRVVFENTSIAFPQQVIFELQSPKVLSITLQNETWMDLSRAQADYLSKRNTIVPQRIVRVMERAD